MFTAAANELLNALSLWTRQRAYSLRFEAQVELWRGNMMDRLLIKGSIMKNRENEIVV